MFTMKNAGLLALVVGAVVAGDCGPAQDGNDKPQGVSGTKKASNFFPNSSTCHSTSSTYFYPSYEAKLCCPIPSADPDNKWADVYAILCGDAPGEITVADCEAKHETDYACGIGGACVRTSYNPSTDYFDIGACELVGTGGM